MNIRTARTARLAPALAAAAAMALLACTAEEPRPALAAGTGSETTNHITGLASQGGFQLSQGARVVAVKEGFNPLTDSVPERLGDMTDSRGRYRIEDVPPGEYRLEARDPVTGMRAQVGLFRHGGAATSVDPVDLMPPGFLAVVLPDSQWSKGGFVFVPGTTYKREVGESRVTSLALPPMHVDSLMYAASAASPWQVVARDIEVQPLVTREIAPKPETYIADFLLDTRTQGAGVLEDVAGFPVLLRLDAGNFDFAAQDGGPLMLGFTDEQGRALAYEVERWDSAAARAEIWVRLDTVRGNSDRQRLRLAWGSISGMGSSNGTAVFPSQDGYLGVWHMGGPLQVRLDATGNGRHASTIGYDGDESVPGAVGYADELDAANDAISLGVVNAARSITLSAWVRMGPPASGYGLLSPLLHKPATASAVTATYAFNLQPNSRNPYLNLSDGQQSATQLLGTVPASTWVLLHATYDGYCVATYLDGRQIQRNVGDFTGNLVQNSHETMIGGLLAGRPGKFAGAVDEVRIERIARSPAWVRLSHENQKADQTLVRRVP